MVEHKTVVCLANSKKPGGRCVAGIELSGGQIADWIRPVPDASGSAVPMRDRSYSNGADPEVLDVMEIAIGDHAPLDHHPENWIYDGSHSWAKTGSIAWADLGQFESAHDDLWIGAAGDSYHGMNDRITQLEASNVSNSLRFLHVSDIALEVAVFTTSYSSKRRVQGHFTYQGHGYALWVSDPIVEAEFLALENGRYDLGDAYLTVSISDPLDGLCYKVIAALIRR